MVFLVKYVYIKVQCRVVKGSKSADKICRYFRDYNLYTRFSVYYAISLLFFSTYMYMDL